MEAIPSNGNFIKSDRGDCEPVAFEQKRRTLLIENLSPYSRTTTRRQKAADIIRKRNLSFSNEAVFGPLPPPDYFYRTDAALDLDDDEPLLEDDETLHFIPEGRNAVEMSSRFYIERNVFSYMANTTTPEKNYYDDEDVDFAWLTQKPVSYIILGKPGVGKTTLAKRLSTKLNVVHIRPEEVIEYYSTKADHPLVNKVLDSGGTIGDKIVIQLLEARVAELDVLHRGYILDGFPMVTSEEVSMEEQLHILQNLPLLPQFVILLNMQDGDLYKRRIEQKIDPETEEIYIRSHYTKFNPNENVFSTDNPPNTDYTKTARPESSTASDVAELNDFSDSDDENSPRAGQAIADDKNYNYETGSENQDHRHDHLDGSRDFVPLTPQIIYRLVFRTEDNPVLVNDDLEQFRNHLPLLQAYVDKFDKRKVLELNSYWAPSVIYRKTHEFLESSGISSAPVPLQIIRPLDLIEFPDTGEYLGEDDDYGPNEPCPEDEPPPPIDWEAAIRAVSIRGLVDPRFRWRLSRWHNLCPVALSLGIKLVGKPELAIAFLDKVFFLSSQEAVNKFILNPRPYLLSEMPLSTTLVPYLATRISENELREEDEEIHESLMKWGKPYEYNNPTGIPFSRDAVPEGEKEDETEEEEDLREDRDILARLEGHPHLYLKTVNKIEAQRCFGDMKYYCPVTFAEVNELRKGSPKFACKYRDRLYYCGDEECVEKFLKAPASYLPIGKPKVPPSPKICIAGSPSCGQEEIALQIAKEYNLCYIDFRQRMHEIMKARFGQDIGPNKTGEVIDLEDSEQMLEDCNSDDDMLTTTTETPYLTTDAEETETEGETETEAEGEEISEKDPNPEQLTPPDEGPRTLGSLNKASIKTYPIGSVQRTERLALRKWKKLTKVESCIQAFLENGIQLPDSVLDEYILPLWKEEPFCKIGFVLIGFPNSDSDLSYLMRNKLFPEFVYLLECQPNVLVERLVEDTIYSWRRMNNFGGKRRSSRKDKMYGEEIPGEEMPGEDYDDETWKIRARVTEALEHYHKIYSKDTKSLKVAMNRHRIDWLPLNADMSLTEAKRELMENITPRLKYRQNIFEDTVRLTMKQANALINRGAFVTSRFKRWCPVEMNNGNIAVNLWNSPVVQKIPILYRRYIYFLAGPENAKTFEDNCWHIINQEFSPNIAPTMVVVSGPPRSGKTSLSKLLAYRLGLVYISGTELINSVIKHSFVAQFADILNELEPTVLADGPQPMLLAEEVLNYIRNGQAVPMFLVYRALDLALQQPKAQYHGVVFDDYPIHEEELQDLLYRGVIPSTVIRLKLDLSETFARCRKNMKMDYNFVDAPEEGQPMIEFMTRRYNHATEIIQLWFRHEVQNMIEIEGTEETELMYETCVDKIKNINIIVKPIPE